MVRGYRAFSCRRPVSKRTEPTDTQEVRLSKVQADKGGEKTPIRTLSVFAWYDRLEINREKYEMTQFNTVQ